MLSHNYDRDWTDDIVSRHNDDRDWTDDIVSRHNDDRDWSGTMETLCIIKLLICECQTDTNK